MAKPVFGLQVSGIGDLEKSLQELSKRTGRAVLERSLRKAAQPMLDAAKRNAPVLDGDLERSLKIVRETVSDPGKAAFAQTMKDTGGDTGAARQALRAAYRAEGGAVSALVLGPDLSDGGSTAHIVEFGTGPRKTQDGKSTGAMPADPFLRPAWDAEAKPTNDRLKTILADEIDKAAKRAARTAAKKRGWEV